jgi:hypothetical protein
MRENYKVGILSRKQIIKLSLFIIFSLFYINRSRGKFLEINPNLFFRIISHSIKKTNEKKTLKKF